MKISDSKIYCSPQKKCIPLSVFLILTIFGVVAGSIWLCTSDNPNDFYRLLFTHNIYKTKTDISFGELFFRNLLPILMLLILQFFSGYFAFGQVLSYFTVIYRGTVCGISSAFAYTLHGISGAVTILAAIPFAVISAAVVILGARETVRQSKVLADFSFFENPDITAPSSRLYMLKFGILILFALAVSLADGVFIYFLGEIFFTVQ